MASAFLPASRLTRLIGKPSTDWTIDDLVGVFSSQQLRLVNLMHVGGDGWLKTLDFVPRDEVHLREVLTSGERADGSSLFGMLGVGQKNATNSGMLQHLQAICKPRRISRINAHINQHIRPGKCSLHQRCASGSFLFGGNGIFQVDDDRIGARIQRLDKALRTIAGNE